MASFVRLAHCVYFSWMWDVMYWWLSQSVLRSTGLPMDDEHHHVARLSVLLLREVLRFLLVDPRLSLLFVDVGSLDVLGI